MNTTVNTALDFFSELYQGCTEGFITVWNKRIGTKWYHVSELKFVAQHHAEDMYFGIGLRKEEFGEWKRGGAQDILCVPCVWMDVDIKSTAHKQEALPASIEEARSLFHLEPSVLVNSGYGLHAYWFLNKPMSADEARKIVPQFQNIVRKKAAQKGWKLDNTSDIARVLRIPGTLNGKTDDKRRVTIIEMNGRRYNKSALISTPARLEHIVSRCAFMKHCLEDAEVLPEPEWYASLSVLARCENGTTAAHDWSSRYPNYSAVETDLKIAHALNDTGPFTCNRIKEITDGSYCSGCQFNVKSPIVLGNIRVAEEGEKGVIDLPCIPTQGLYPPLSERYQYNITMDGIWRMNEKGSEKIFPVPVIISKRLRNIDSGEEKIEISFYRDNKWHAFISDRPTAFNSSKVIDLAAHSFPISSASSKDFVRYLSDFEAANLDMPCTTSVSHMGWVEDQFVPGHADSVECDAPRSFTNAFRSKGTLVEWVENMRPILQFPRARLVLASSFASPLLHLLNQRNILLYIYGDSRGGKTAITKAALSVWGRPSELLLSFNSTQNAIERKAAFTGHLPLAIDERQVVNDQTWVEKMIYMLGNGQSRGRAKRDGSLQDEFRWNNVVIATGEEPMSSDNSRAGIISRMIELYGKPIADEKIAADLHSLAEDAYGVAGIEFIRCVREYGSSYVREKFKSAKEIIKNSCPLNIDSHISAITTIILANTWMCTWIFGKQDFVSEKESIELGVSVLNELQKSNEVDEGKRSYEAFESWLASNQSLFSSDAREAYGWCTEDGHVYIYPTSFKKIMKDLGFNEKRVKIDWAEKNILEAERRIGENQMRYSVRKYSPHLRRTVSVVSLNLDH